MFLRQPLDTSLAQIRERLDEKGELISALSTDIKVDLTGDTRVIRVNNREVPVTSSGLHALGGRFDVPIKFLERQDPDFQERILNTLMERNPMINAVKLNNDGLLEIRDEGRPYLDVRKIVDVAERIVGKEATVLDWWKEPNREFRLDVVVHTESELSWGGDREVGDLTGAGLRFTQNLRQSDQIHSPEVGLLLYRLACTNGYESVDEDDRIDARGSTLDEILVEYEALADNLFKRAEEKISSFYEMRQVAVDEPAQRILRVGREAGLSDRIITEMVARVPEFIDDGENGFSEFDLVNLITNTANDPRIRRSSARRKLQGLGGHLIGEHAARCSSCQSKLSR